MGLKDSETAEQWVRHAFDLTRVGESDQARLWMEKAASHGHRQAPIFAAIWRLVGYGGPVEPDSARTLLEHAVRNGEPLGLTMLAALAVSDLQGPRDWDRALSLLLDAARLGESRAILQLAMLLPDGDPAKPALVHGAAALGNGTARYFHGRALCAEPTEEERTEGHRWLSDMAARGEPCSRLYLTSHGVALAGGTPRESRPGVDFDFAAIGARVKWPHGRPVPATVVQHTSPSVASIPGLLTPDECQYLISRGAPYLQPAAVGTAAGAAAMAQVRSNDSMLFSAADTDVIVQSLDSRIAAVLGQPAENGERLALLRYQPGQAYAAHCDWIDPRDPGKAAMLAAQGQRVSTLLTYLNDEYDGGETRFVRVGWSFKGAPGDALLWSNTTPTGDVDPQTLHAGEPPTRGEKWLLSKWMRNRSQAAAASTR
ncbi:MAG TPA: 2OG-Fe(II) oxygenase [Steroidobacteraceae bacterium]|nr:2OG-Fe(II) oxygenase [Steroidobacteraceae bacterium]